MSFELAELQRQFFNLVRLGTISEVDYSQNMARVTFGEVVTGYLPWLAIRAGGNRTYDSLEVGEQVLVLSFPGDDFAVILGAVYKDAHPAPDTSPEIQKTIYKDGTVVIYDRQSHTLKADVKGDVLLKTTGKITAEAGGDVGVTAGGSVSITAPSITLNGQTIINGTLSQGGGSNGGSATFGSSLHAIGQISTDADVVADCSLNSHTHSCRDGGTGGPN